MISKVLCNAMNLGKCGLHKESVSVCGGGGEGYRCEGDHSWTPKGWTLSMPESRSGGRKKSHFIPIKIVWKQRIVSRQS